MKDKDIEDLFVDPEGIVEDINIIEIEEQAKKARPEPEFLEGDKIKEMEEKWKKEKEEMQAQMEELKKSIETKKEPEPDPEPKPDPENKE